MKERELFTLGSLINSLITSQFRSQPSRLRQIELFLRFALIELGGVGVGCEGKDPGDGDGVEGYVLGGEEGCHCCLVD